MISKWVIGCQVWEWYGNEEFTDGRYKPKGGESFVFEMPYEELYEASEEELMNKWNEKFNKNGQWVRYEARSIDAHFEPQKATFVDGEFNIVRE